MNGKEFIEYIKSGKITDEEAVEIIDDINKEANKMPDNKEIKQELQRQIELIVRTKAYSKTTIQDVQKVVDLLGGNLEVDMTSEIGTVCYYLTLLVLKKQT